MKEGTIAIGEWLVVVWGKKKKAYNAEVVSVPLAASRSEETSASKSDKPSTASRNEETFAASSSEVQLQREVVEKCAPPPLDYSVFPPPMDYSAFTLTAPLRTLPSESATQSTPYLPETDNPLPSSTSGHHPQPKCGWHHRRRLQCATRSCLCSSLSRLCRTWLLNWWGKCFQPRKD